MPATTTLHRSQRLTPSPFLPKHTFALPSARQRGKPFIPGGTVSFSHAEQPGAVTIYYKDIPMRGKKGEEITVTVQTMPPDINSADAVGIYNAGWNVLGYQDQERILHITLENFTAAICRNPAGIIAALAQDNLAGFIWAIDVLSIMAGARWLAYDEIVTPFDYFSHHSPMGRYHLCMAVNVPKNYNGYRTIGSDDVPAALSLGHMEVLSERVLAQRSPHITNLIAFSRLSSLESYLRERMQLTITFGEQGEMYAQSSSDTTAKEFFTNETGLYYQNGQKKEYFLTLEEYFQATRENGKPWDQMLEFHHEKLGAAIGPILPNSRIRTVEGKVLRDKAALGYNILFIYDMFEDVQGFFTSLTKAQQQFVKLLAQYVVSNRRSHTDLFGQIEKRGLLHPFALSWQGPNGQIIKSPFDVEKTRLIMAAMRRDIEATGKIAKSPKQEGANRIK